MFKFAAIHFSQHENELQNIAVSIAADEILGTAMAIETMGGKHHNCNVDDICVDEKNKIVTTPAYMLGPGIKDIAVGIEKLVKKVLALID